MKCLDFAVRFFFFSSRRRHTRFDCDWSSDVCSSDLAKLAQSTAQGESAAIETERERVSRLLPRNPENALAERASEAACLGARASARRDRKSTRLNSSHSQISYAVFCLKKNT